MISLRFLHARDIARVVPCAFLAILCAGAPTKTAADSSSAATRDSCLNVKLSDIETHARAAGKIKPGNEQEAAGYMVGFVLATIDSCDRLAGLNPLPMKKIGQIFDDYQAALRR